MKSSIDADYRAFKYILEFIRNYLYVLGSYTKLLMKHFMRQEPYSLNFYFSVLKLYFIHLETDELEKRKAALLKTEENKLERK